MSGQLFAIGNHASNVSAYSILLKESGQTEDSPYIMFESKKIYLRYDPVHLLKSIRNNVVNYKRLFFPPFKFNAHDKDNTLGSHLRKASKLSLVVHPGNCKQSVPVALSVFDPTTSAAIQSYFPDRKASAEFLRLIDTWWVISNAKQQISSRRLGHAVKEGDNEQVGKSDLPPPCFRGGNPMFQMCL